MTQISIKSQNTCTISWDAMGAPDWDAAFRKIPRSTLLQAWDYGHVMGVLNHQRVRRGVITIGGKQAGLVQILEAGILGNALHGVVLDRGPLWFEGFGSAQDFESFVQCFCKMFPKRFGRKVRFIPEAEDNAYNRDILKTAGFVPKSVGGYQTMWVDLRPQIDVLRKGLHSNWRNKLSRAEKAGIEVVWDIKGKYLSWLVLQATHDQEVRGYQGASEKLLYGLAERFQRGENMLIGAAVVDNRLIAAILVFIHGSCATYQIGYTSEMGRDKCAHHLLLWNALAVLKERSVHDFDLGGVNDEGAQGVKAFKQGLGGEVIETMGLFN